MTNVSEKKKDKAPLLSYFLMGWGNLRAGQIVRGLLYLLLEISFIVFFLRTGIGALQGLITLGTNQQGMVFNEEIGIYERIDGDNSMLLLLGGVVTLFVIVFFLILYFTSIRSGAEALAQKAAGKRPASFRDDIRSLTNGNIHKLLLAIPLGGLVLFTVMPLVYMILMAFTNYDVNHQPPGNLFDWVGLENFKTLLASSDKLSQTFWPILGWTAVWAVFATFSNYFLGMFLAMLINNKDIKGKKLWRTIFVLTIAIPSFVSLLVIRTMLNKNGVINTQLMELGFITQPLPFLTNATWARVTVIVANMWIGIPYTMLITTGILTNIPADLYESAKMDGAGPVTTFRKITFPYIFFITTPYLISNFIANVNNFNPIYFLTEGGPLTLDYFKGAGKTDLLVTWLYKLTKDSMDYNYAAAIGIVIFVISASISILVYTRSGAFKNEEGFQL
jgi:arabinogalactan oligomer/maltooligosaccharide transport system permease protein